MSERTQPTFSAGSLATLTAWAEAAGVFIIFICRTRASPWPTIKRHATANGNASKDANDRSSPRPRIRPCG